VQPKVGHLGGGFRLALWPPSLHAVLRLILMLVLYALYSYSLFMLCFDAHFVHRFDRLSASAWALFKTASHSILDIRQIMAHSIPESVSFPALGHTANCCSYNNL
jgi:hypothetical protein